MITILGAGLAGLALARVLHLHSRPFALLDADMGPHARHQGGMLDIHEDSGQWALEAMGLLPGFQALTLPGGDTLRVLDRAGTLRLAGGSGGARPEIDRGALRDLLLDSLPGDAVRWGAKVATAERQERGARLTLATGGSIDAPFLVGADGAWSRVRPLLTDAQPVHAGLAFVESRLLGATARHLAQAGAVGDGLMFALGEGQGFIAHREPGDELCAYAIFPAPEGLDPASLTVDAVRARFRGWSPDLLGLVTDADAPLVARPLHALPVGLHWHRVPGVTLAGDAAHLMSPFAGEGANLAMQDGAALGLALVGHDDVEVALAAYEADLFARAEAAAQQSAQGLAMIFTPDAPAPLVDFFLSVGAGAVPATA